MTSARIASRELVGLQLREWLQRRPETGAVAVIAAAWLVLLAAGTSHLLAPLGSQHQMVGMAQPLSQLPDRFTSTLAMTVLMSVAMMGPAALAGIRHTGLNSLRWRRNRAMAEFAGGYLLVWTGYGIVLSALGALIPDRSRTIGLVLALALAAGWQLTRYKRRWLRDCHRSRPLPPRGWRAERAAAGFGTRIGLACLGSCWCLMLIPVAAPAGVLVWAALLSAAIAIERTRQQPRRTTRLIAVLLVAGSLSTAIVSLTG